MSKIGIDVEANVSKARKDLQSLNKDVTNLHNNAKKGAKIKVDTPKAGNASGGLSIGGLGLDKLGGLGKLGDVKGLISGGLGRFGGMGVGGVAGAAAGVAGAGIALAGAWHSHIKGLVDQGKAAQDTYERLNATLGQIGKNVAGVKDVSTTVKFLQEMAAKGKTPLEALEQTANRLMVAFKGNQTEVKKWVEIIADMSAGSGESATMLTEVITKAKQFDKVEFSVFTQLNEKGIPIIKALAEHLGTTTEEAEKLARAGKVTGDNFMAAYELAHKMTFAGANTQGGTATMAGAQNAITKYKELQAAAATQGYNSAMLPYLQERAALEEQRYNDPYFRLNNQASGQLVGGLEVLWNKLGDSVSDFGDWCSKLLGSGIAESLGRIESINAGIGTITFRGGGVKGTMFKSVSRMEELEERLADAKLWHETLDSEDTAAELAAAEKAYNDNWHTSAEIDGWLNTLRAQLAQERAKANNANFDDETRAKAREAVVELEQAISICEDAMRAVKAHEAELAEIEKKKKAEAEGKLVKETYAKSRAETAEQYAAALGFTNLDALKSEYQTLQGKIESGKGTQADLERINELQKVIDIAEKEEKAADAERKKEEARAKNRADYDLAAKAADGDLESKVQLEMQREAEKLKALGFTPAEVEARLNATRDRMLKDAKEKQAATDAALQEQYEDNYYNYRGSADSHAFGNHAWERNAWGAAGATYTKFMNPYDQQQLTELEKANTNLSNLIKATQAIDTRALAQ